MMTHGHRQEALCRAYVQAVAALAGVATSTHTPGGIPREQMFSIEAVQTLMGRLLEGVLP
jgi:hypothetical protein